MAILCLLTILSDLYHLQWVRLLPVPENLTQGNVTNGVKLPRVSVVIAARDEEDRIGQTIRNLLNQQGVDLEIIVVDDRSTDQTSGILKQLASEEKRLVVKRIDSLPEGWLGKCHACHLGAQAVTADWILFTDADCHLASDVISRALLVAEEQAVDHITLTSGLASPSSTALKASHLLFVISMANWFSGVNRDRPKSYMGIGAFNLVRASVYRKSGGHQALRLTVLEDMRLGLLIRRAGGRTRAFMGATDAECHWGTNIWSTVTLMEKNYFAAVDYRLWVVILLALFTVAFITLIFLGFLSSAPTGLLAAFSPLLLSIPAAVLARRLGWSILPALFSPFTFPVVIWSVLNSTFKTLRQKGIRWRDTFYPLHLLKEGNVK